MSLEEAIGKTADGIADELIEKRATVAALLLALHQIAALGGNLPDTRLTTRTGPGDAAHRGLMYCSARYIAEQAIAAAKKE